MANYVDVVAVKFDDEGQVYLYRAPKFSHLKPGTDVLTEDDVVCEVVSTMTCEANGEDLEFVMAVAGITELPKLKAVFYRSDLEYGDDEV